jgi:hypothetical protein
MENLHHKSIKKFSLDGSIHDDSAIERLRNEYIRLLSVEMELSGYAKRLDINPDFTISYNESNDTYNFVLTMYGVYVGKNRAQWISGIDGTTIIYTQQSRLKEYSQDQA